ncbi:MAG: hypothetical protein MHM6MM_006985 [Cercozoa sp. M6MM]
MLTSRQARQKERHLLQNPAILRHFLWAQGQVAIGANTLPRITAAAEDIAGHKYITYDFTEAARKPETEGGSDTSSWSFSVHARYRPIDILGEGAYGKVLLAEDLLQPVREYSHPVSQKLPVPLPDEGPVLAATPPLGVPHTPVCARIRYRRVAIKRIQLHDYHPIFSVRTLRELRLLRLVTKNVSFVFFSQWKLEGNQKKTEKAEGLCRTGKSRFARRTSARRCATVRMQLFLRKATMTRTKKATAPIWSALSN